jgi:class 3 adenylate cyclase
VAVTALLNLLYARLGARYPRVAIAATFAFSHVAAIGGVWLLTLYQPMTGEQFWTILLVGEGLVLLENLLALPLAYRLLRPADPWLRGRRTPAAALAAWRALAGLPLGVVSHRRPLAIAMNLAPISLFITAYLGLPWYAALVLFAGAAVVLLYGVFLRFFAVELSLRPVLADVSRDVPEAAELPAARSIALRWRLLLALPAINVVTGVVVSALSASGPTSLRDLGFDVLFAVLVAFTVSLVLSLMLASSVLRPLAELQRATERVTRGDFGARVPVVSGDETGALARSFNTMVAGLQEREALREAFGTYVAPHLADRVLAEGAVLEGEEVEVTVVFVDLRDFTAFSERASAHEVVAVLNGFFDLVVPVLVRHGGHANKFVGDGVLGVFGAPDHLPDHADRGLAAAVEVVEAVRDAYGQSLSVGIGVNSGTVVAGTVGGGGRLEFTVIGDPVNTAARVQQATRETGDAVLLTEATRALLQDPPALVPRGTIELRGKRDRVQVHAPVLPAWPPAVPEGEAPARARTR